MDEVPANGATGIFEAVQRRVGRMLANFSAKFSPQSSKQLVVNSIQTCPLDKP
jgi:hypothetical protein